MLKTLRLHNFRTFLNAELAFGQRHLVIGKNNSGKTNLCTALRFLRACSSHDLSASILEVPGGIGEIKNWAFDSSEVDVSCVCDVPFEGTPHQYTYDLRLKIETSSAPSQQGQPVLHVSHESLVVKGPGFADITLLENDGHEAHMLHEGSDEGYTAKTLAPSDATMLSKLYELETNRRAIAFRRYLSSWLYFALSPDAMRFRWREVSPGLTPLLPRGDNLAVLLFHLKIINERRYRRIIDHARLIEPDLEAINFLATPDQVPLPFVALRSTASATWQGLSDGTLRALALAFIAEALGGLFPGAIQPPAPLVVIEEPENGLYPGQLRRFFDQFEERASAGQFLFTSHSPYFINFFDAHRECVTLLRRSNERTEVLPVPPADEEDPDRPLLAEQYSMELLD